LLVDIAVQALGLLFGHARYGKDNHHERRAQRCAAQIPLTRAT